MNTEFHYLYRDASNYKNYGSIVFSGSPKEALKERLKIALREGENFIADQIGIPEIFLWSKKQQDSQGSETDYEPSDYETFNPYAQTGSFPLDPKDDHCWHEFLALEETNKPTNDQENRSFEEFIQDVETANKAGWMVFDPKTVYSQNTNNL